MLRKQAHKSGWMAYDCMWLAASFAMGQIATVDTVLASKERCFILASQTVGHHGQWHQSCVLRPLRIRSHSGNKLLSILINWSKFNVCKSWSKRHQRRFEGKKRWIFVKNVIRMRKFSSQNRRWIYTKKMPKLNSGVWSLHWQVFDSIGMDSAISWKKCSQIMMVRQNSPHQNQLQHRRLP